MSVTSNTDACTSMESQTLNQSKLVEMNNLLEGTTPLIRSGESSLGSSSHNLVLGFDGIFRSEKCVKLFQDFLGEQKQVNYLLCWLAINGFKKVREPAKADHLARIIHRSFMKSEKPVNSEKPVKLSSSVIRDIEALIDCSPVSRSIFDKAHSEIEHTLRCKFYPQFTKWDGAHNFEFVECSPSATDNPPMLINSAAPMTLQSSGGFCTLDTSDACLGEGSTGVGGFTLTEYNLTSSICQPNSGAGGSSAPCKQHLSSQHTTHNSHAMSPCSHSNNLTSSCSAGLTSTMTGQSLSSGALICNPNATTSNSSSAACNSNSVVHHPPTESAAGGSSSNNNTSTCICCTTLSSDSSASILFANLSSSHQNPQTSKSSRHQRRGKSQESCLDDKVLKESNATGSSSKLHHGRAKSSNASSNLMTNISSSYKKGGLSCSKPDFNSKRPPEMLPPSQFAAILIRKLEELQVRQQQQSQKGSSGSHDSQTCQSYSAHERSSNNIEVLRNQLLAVSAASAQTSDVATSSQDEDPNNIIDSHVNRVFRDTLDCSPSPSYSPTPLCADCAPGTGSQTHGGSNQATSGVSCCHHHSSSSGGKNCSTLPSRLLHHCQQISSAGASHNNNNSINSSNITSSAKLFSSSMKRGNRLETCSNLSVSSGVDSGCFDVSSQFSTESESASRHSILNWTRGDSECKLGGAHPMKSSYHGVTSSSSELKSSRSAALRNSASARASNRWASTSTSPHRHANNVINGNSMRGLGPIAPLHLNSSLINTLSNSLQSNSSCPSCCYCGEHLGAPNAIRAASPGGSSCDMAMMMHDSPSCSSSSSCSSSCSSSAAATAASHNQMYAANLCECTHLLSPPHLVQYQKKSRSNSAERPFNGASLAVYKQEIPKTTTSESLFGLQNPNEAQSPHACVFAPPQFVQSSSGKSSRNQPASKDAIVSLEAGGERKKSTTWNKQKNMDKSRHFNTCTHLGGMSQFQDAGFSAHVDDLQEDSAFDESSCAEDSYFSSCSTEAVKKLSMSSSSNNTTSTLTPQQSAAHLTSASSCGGLPPGTSSQNNTTQSNMTFGGVQPNASYSTPSGGASGAAPPAPSVTTSPANGAINNTVVAYFFCGEPIPYRTVVQSKQLTLADFKALLTRKGNYRYFFKMRSDEIEIGGIVNEEVTEDNAILPFFDGKIIGRIEKQSTGV